MIPRVQRIMRDFFMWSSVAMIVWIFCKLRKKYSLTPWRILYTLYIDENIHCTRRATESL